MRPSRTRSLVLAFSLSLSPVLILALAPLQAGADCTSVPGDIAPGVLDGSTVPPTHRPAGNLAVDIADVVVGLRTTVGLQKIAWNDPGPGCPPIPGDVAPGVLSNATVPPTWTILGDGLINIADVVVLLRRTVGLQSLLLANGSLSGQVADVSTGAPLAGVAVQLIGGPSATTDANGFFSFSNLQPGEVVGQFSRPDLAPTVERLIVTSDGEPFAFVAMKLAGAAKFVDAGAGGAVQEQNAMVAFPGDAFVSEDGMPVTGEVQGKITFTDPTTADVLAFPGDFADAMTEGGAHAKLESFGFVNVELSQDGAPVDLAPGEMATLELVLPDAAQGKFSAGQTIPLWALDEETATWHEAGEGTVGMDTGGSGKLSWIAEVSHFSWYNCGTVVTGTSCVTGEVTDGGGPVAGATVTAVGVDHGATSTMTTDADGHFCIEVKRGSTVRLEVRPNGSAFPLAVHEITVPDTEASCAGGECFAVGFPLTIALDACVSGVVTGRNGEPAGGVTVRLVPGTTEVTGPDGTYCGRAPSGALVAVVAEGWISASVLTSGGATCASGPCDIADLVAPLPADGDVVGDAFVGYSRTIAPNFEPEPQLEESERLSMFGLFFADLFTSGGGGSTCTVEHHDQDGCAITVFDCIFVFDPQQPPPPAPVGQSVLDPGAPGLADNGSAMVELERGDPFLFDPPRIQELGEFFLPFEADPLALGFGPGQAVELSWPGGVDIGAFAATIDVPQAIEVLTPDLMDAELALPVGSPLTVTWMPAPTPLDAISLSASTTVRTTELDEVTGVFTTYSAFVTIRCTVQDSLGTATLTGAVTGFLQSDPTSWDLSLNRYSGLAEASAPLRRTMGQGIVYVSSSSSVTRRGP